MEVVIVDEAAAAKPELGEYYARGVGGEAGPAGAVSSAVNDALVIGLDVGGSTSRARLSRGDELVQEVRRATASVSALGVDAARAALRELIGDLGTDSVAAVCLGTAGSGSEDIDALLRETVHDVVDTPRVLVVNDAELLLPAAGHDEGVAIVSGTGAKAVGTYAGRTAVSGGWGYLLGDEGSGYWIVREAIRVVLHREDVGAPRGELGDRLLDAEQIDRPAQLIERFHGQSAPERWARHAPLVLDADDAARDDILTRAARQLSARADEVLAGLDAPADLPLVLAGGVLTGSARLAEAVRRMLLDRHPRLHVRLLREPPVAGAVRLAQLAAAERRDNSVGRAE